MKLRYNLYYFLINIILLCEKIQFYTFIYIDKFLSMIYNNIDKIINKFVIYTV